MSDTDRQNELQAALLNGDLAAGDSPAVLALFRERPDLLLDLSSSLAVDRLLAIAAEPLDERAAFSREVVARLKLKPQPEAFTRTVRKRLKPQRRSWARVALPIAASLALLAGLGWWMTRDHALARVAATADVTWSAGAGPNIGEALDPESSLSIESGLVEVSLANRGHVVLEGPATLTVHGKKEFTLPRGRAVFYVTPRGHGLTVRTPHGTAIDLGTSFALEVGEDKTELHILQGSVAFDGVAGGRSTLRAGEAIAAREKDTEVITADPERYVQQVPSPRTAAPDALYWPCDEGGGKLADTRAREFGMQLESAFPGGNAPGWTSGPSSPALALDGEGGFAQSSYPGVKGSTPRTVALWVKLPADWTPEDAGALVSWGRFEWQEPGVMFELTLNRDRSLGPLGAPQLDTFGHRVTAEANLRDGKWHHLAVTTYQGSAQADRTHVLFYLDGRLVSSFPRSIPRIDTVVSGARHGVILGRSIQSISIPQPPPEAFFRGAIDGIYIASDTLSTPAIRKLMAGNPPRASR